MSAQASNHRAARYQTESPAPAQPDSSSRSSLHPDPRAGTPRPAGTAPPSSAGTVPALPAPTVITLRTSNAIGMQRDGDWRWVTLADGHVVRMEAGFARVLAWDVMRNDPLMKWQAPADMLAEAVEQLQPEPLPWKRYALAALLLLVIGASWSEALMALVVGR